MLRLSPMSCLGSSLAVDLLLTCSSGFAAFIANVLTFGGEPKSGLGLRELMKIGYGTPPRPGSRDFLTACGSDLTGVLRARPDLPLFTSKSASSESSDASISSFTDYSLTWYARPRASSFCFSCSNLIVLSIGRVLCFLSYCTDN